MKNIIIYDSHPVSILGITLLLSEMEEQFQVFTTSSPAELNKFLAYPNIGLVFFGLNNLAEFQDLHKKYLTRFPWLVYYDENTTEAALKLLSYGAKGCLAKGRLNKDIILGINTVLYGGEFICETSFRLFAECCSRRSSVTDRLSTSSLHSKGKNRQLSSRQRQVAKLLITGMRTSQIAENLMIKNSTVSTIKRQIFTKMCVSDVFQLAAALD